MLCIILGKGGVKMKNITTADMIVNEIKSCVVKNPLNRMAASEKDSYFDEPMVQFAAGNDPLFTEYKSIIGPEHLTPRGHIPTACSTLTKNAVYV
jgi:hypothetical protein